MSDDSPYTPPKSKLIEVGSTEVVTKGRYAIHMPDVEWPGRCFKCNADTNNKKKVNVAYVNPWIFLSILLSPLITVILVVIFQKKYSIDLPICEMHIKKRKRFSIIQWSMAALTLASFVVGAVTESKIILVISVVLLLAVVVLAIYGRLVYIARRKKENLWVVGTGKDFRASLPDFVR